MKLTGIFLGPGLGSSNSFLCSNSECLVNLGPPEGLKHLLAGMLLAPFLKKYCPGSTYSSPIAFDCNLLNVSVVESLPRVLEKFLTLPISPAALLSF